MFKNQKPFRFIVVCFALIAVAGGTFAIFTSGTDAQRIIITREIKGAKQTPSRPDVAVTIASWGFEAVTTTNTGQTPVLVGSGTADAGAQTTGSAFTGFHTASTAVWSNPAGNGSSHSFSSNGWGIGDYYQFLFKTTGYTGISITWDQVGSATGPRDFKVQYSIDGSTFLDAAGANSTYQVLSAPSFSAAASVPDHTRTVDLSTVIVLNNQANVFIRVVNTSATSINGGSVAATGTGRVDNFIASGTATTAAGVSVSGRVVTSDGRGLRNAAVVLTDSKGISRTVITGAFGTYEFDDVDTGSTYLIGVSSKQYRFEQRVVQVFDTVTDADFVAMN